MSNKVNQVAGGLIWTYAERLLAQLITILVTIVLARLISPDEYGMIAIVNVFINIANAFVTNGFGNSLVQKKDADEVDFSTVFFFSVAFSSAIYCLVFACSGYIADFYSMPDLKLIIRVMAVRLPIAAINSIQHAYISKKMEFKKFFLATLGGTIISAVIGIAMAKCGYGIWALVAQYLSNVCINTIVLFLVSSWKPKCIYSQRRMKSLFSYGWKIMYVGVMSTVYSNLRNLIIGKKYTSAELAYSEKGEQFPSAIAGNINSSIIKVLFPVLSESQNEQEQLKRMVRRSIKVGVYMLFPVLFGFAMVAESFVEVLLTEKWTGCIPFLQIMCIVYALQPLQAATLQCIKALGESSLYLKIDVVKKIIGIVVLLFTIVCFDDVLIIIFGALIVEIVSYLILLPYNKRLINYNYKEQLSDILPTCILTGLMCIGIKAVDVTVQVDGLFQLVAEVAIGAIIYLGMSLVTRNEDLKYILNIVLNFCGRSKKK